MEVLQKKWKTQKKIYIIISIICVLSIVLGAYAQFFGKRDSKTSDIPTNNTTDENVIENPVQPEKKKLWKS